MTIDFAMAEAKRRTTVLGTTHYVIYAAESWAACGAECSYLVSTRKPDNDRHVVVETFEPIPICDTCGNLDCHGCVYPLT